MSSIGFCLRILGLHLAAMAVAASLLSASAAQAQTVESDFLPAGLPLGFGMLQNRILEGVIQETKADVASPVECANACSNSSICRSFTYVSGTRTCEFKGNNTFAAGSYSGYVSGVSLSARDFRLVDQPVGGPKRRIKTSYLSIIRTFKTTIEDACAAQCQTYAIEKRCRAFSTGLISSESRLGACYLSESTELQDEIPPRSIPSTTMLAAGDRADFVIADLKILHGEIRKSTPDVGKLDDCAALCKADGTCNSFTYIPSRRICEFKGDHRFAPGTYVGYVSGVRKDFRMRVQGVYLVPKGQMERPDAPAAIEAALQVVQEHFGRQLGRTFLIESPAVTVVRTEKEVSEFAYGHASATPSAAVDFDSPPTDTPLVAVAKTQLGEDYVLRKNLIVFVIEGLTRESYGQTGTVAISAPFWTPVLDRYKDRNKLLESASGLAAWTHELGHAFGLFHWDDVANCRSQPLGSLGSIGSAIMWQATPAQRVFDYYFADWEKDRLLGKNVDVDRSCFQRYPATSDNYRPGSDGYLRMEYTPKQ